jgi:hypothetical protein
MDLDEEIFEKKLKELNKSIFSSVENKSISADMDNLFTYISSKWHELEFFRKFDELINVVFIQRVLKERVYVDGFLKKYLNIYFETLKTDFYSSWGLVFSKILLTKNIETYPSIYSYLMKIIFPKLPKYEEEKLVFPIDDDVSLYDIINSWLPVIEDQVLYSSSYDLFLNSGFRNNLIMHLYGKYKRNKVLNIWFPFGGIGAEPLLFSYLLLLVIETDLGSGDPQNVFIHASDHNPYVIERGLSSGLFDELLVRVKDDFCTENGIKSKDLKTTIKQAKRKVSVYPADLIYKSDIIDKKNDTIIMNSLKLSDHANENVKFEKIINRVSQNLINSEVIYVMRNSEPLSADKFSIGNSMQIKSIDNEFVSLKNDWHLNMLSFDINETNSVGYEIRKKGNYGNIDLELNKLYESRLSAENADLKKKLIKINSSSLVKSGDKLKYAELLAISGYHSRSYEIIKKNYKSDYRMSYDIMQKILDASKNEKLNSRIGNFIKENQIKEKGFSGELLDAIVEEIDDFFKRNPNSILNREKWLI